MDQVKIIAEVDDSFYLLDGLLLNKDYAIFTESNGLGTSIFYAKVQFNEEFAAYETLSIGNIDIDTKVSDPMKALYEVREALHGISLFTLITKLEHLTEEGFGLINEDGKVKEWKHDK
ncbi:hypothetical protein [Bacillus sp. J37]|uniref:hypothetical protein n=1 Tax=Bacillus sp. J37 TaxID=935837 RepID=UPI00047D04C7|nr:hypothetical protein [Bacillus sp. J37]